MGAAALRGAKAAPTAMEKWQEDLKLAPASCDLWPLIDFCAGHNLPDRAYTIYVASLERIPRGAVVAASGASSSAASGAAAGAGARAGAAAGAGAAAAGAGGAMTPLALATAAITATREAYRRMKDSNAVLAAAAQHLVKSGERWPELWTAAFNASNTVRQELAKQVCIYLCVRRRGEKRLASGIAPNIRADCLVVISCVSTIGQPTIGQWTIVCDVHGSVILSQPTRIYLPVDE